MKKIFLDAISWSNKWYFSSFSGLIGSFLFFKNVFNFSPEKSIWWSLIFIPFTIIVRMFYQFFRKEAWFRVKLYMKEKELAALKTPKGKEEALRAWNFYGEAMGVLKEVFGSLNHLSKSEQLDKNNVTDTLSILCDHLKALYEKRFPGNVYSVSVKVIGLSIASQNIDHNAQIITICRDKISLRKRSFTHPVRHDIQGNTCFLEVFYNIVDPDKNYYLSNCLPEEKKYRNTNFAYYDNLPDIAVTADEKRKHWTLPYKSELVVPIIPVRIENVNEIMKQFVGYISVNCTEEFGFHYRYDPEMMKGVADAVHKILKSLP